MKKFAVIILGGGPAGVATALTLAGYSYAVLVIERSQYQDWRVGETLPPHIQTVLGPLGVWERFLCSGQLASSAIHAAWGSHDFYETQFIFNPYGPGWHLDRKQFDSMLAEAAEDAGVTVLRGTRAMSVSRSNESWQLVIQSNETLLKLEASFLVDATGRSSWLARSLRKKRITYDNMIGIVGVLTPQTSHVTVEPVLQLEAVADGWWYSAPVPDGSLVLTYMTDSDYLTSSHLRPTDFWSSQLAATKHSAARSHEFRLKRTVYVRSANTARLESPIGAGWLAVGDAASTYDPLSSEGVSKALRSGSRASQAIHNYLINKEYALDEYAGEFAKEFEDYLRQRVQYYRRETRWSDSLFWSRRQIGR